MKKITLTLLFSFLASLFCSFATYAADTYTLDPNHTYVLWKINHLGFSTQAGKWYASGTLVLDKDKPQNSKVNAAIQINNVVTGIPELDKHIGSKALLDADQFPTATFVSNKVDVTGNDTANVQGTLTLHGVSKPVTLNVKFNKSGVNPISNKMSAGFSATTSIKRSDFGITGLLPALGDQVDLNIEAEGSLKQ